MKKFLVSLLKRPGGDNEKVSPQKVEHIDPKSILFSTPTLSNDLAPFEPITEKPNSSDLVFHEDEWCQVEFLGGDRLKEVQNTLKEYKEFELTHRAQYGWHKVFVRTIERAPMIQEHQSVELLEQLLGISVVAAPILFTSNTITGRVKDGFSLPLGGNVTIYGYQTNLGVTILGANIGKNPNDLMLAEAFMKLNAKFGLILVDWRAQMILTSKSESGQINIWRP